MAILIDQPEFGVEAGFNKVDNVEKEMVFDGGFMVPQTNSFGYTFRDYHVESERQQGVENFHRTNHINQTYDFVMDSYVYSISDDESDPDLDEPQIEHLLHTAEAIRKDYPEEDWLHLAGFVHDLGKVLLHPSFGGLPRWAVVGDTYPVGCAFDKSIVHHKVAKVNNTTLPPAALFIIRYHSFYALHRSEAYKHLMSEEDIENLKWLQIFKYDFACF
ncbi:Inositol oxygenase - like 3 [Theobroma cacao]|nr:Inositol oxygenase - like 3 [Theobroma cacao]